MDLKNKTASAKLSLVSAGINLITLIAFCIYGGIYEYFDSVVFLALILGVVCFVLYAMLDKLFAEILNLVGVFCVGFGLGLFFLNSYPVWADRLNNITMYGSRGTLVPVVIIILLCLVTALVGIVSCFTRKECKS